MTRAINRRRPDPARLTVHNYADHVAGACLTGCPWCTMLSQPPEVFVILDEPLTEKPLKGPPCP